MLEVGTTGVFRDGTKSDAYLRLMVEELMPFIATHYAVTTEATNTFLMESSQGATISVNALIQSPDYFEGVAAMSTHWLGSFGIDHLFDRDLENPVPALFYKYRRENLPAPGRLKFYFDHGTKTFDSLCPSYQRQVDSIMEETKYGGENWMIYRPRGGSHFRSLGVKDSI